MGRPCAECLDPEATGCQCSGDSSTTVAITGSGEPGDPFVWNVILSPDPTNRIYDDGSGLVVPIPGHLRAWASDDQLRAPADTIGFNNNDSHVGNALAPGVTHPTGAGNHVFTIDDDGWYTCKARATLDDEPDLSGGTLRWIDNSSGDFLSQASIPEAPWAVETAFEEYFEEGDEIAVRLDFTGASTVTVLGDSTDRGYRTVAVVRKVHGA